VILARPLVAGAAFAASACAPALSSFQPAHVPEKGHVQAELGMDVAIPTGTIHKAIDAAESLEAVAENRALTDSEKHAILEGGVNLATNPPAAIPHLGVAYAPFEHWELGLRFAASGWRVGARRQILEQERSGVDLSVGIGVGRAAFEPPVDNVLSTIEIDDFVRWNVDLPIAVGRHGDWYRWWAGPRLLYTSMSQSMTLSLPAESAEVAAISGSGFYVGAQGGAVFGYRWLFVGPELTLVQLFADAEVEALGQSATVDLDSFVVYPGLALLGEF
jgi:hypothetical protein